jgi:uncharacterized protein (TIGR00369 family)
MYFKLLLRIFAMKSLPRYRQCFVCGDDNSAGLAITFRTDGEKVYAEFSPKECHIGYQDHIHGGILASVLDEIMGWAICARTGLMFYTWELTIRYHRPAHPGMRLRAVANMVEDKGRYQTAEGYITDEQGEIYARGTGKYKPIKDEERAEILSYLEKEDGERPTVEDLLGG